MNIFILLALLTSPSFASTIYMSGSPSQVQLALEAEYGIGAGVGAKEGKCTLCHASADGGPANIQPAGFGMDFMNAAFRLGITGRGGMSLPTLGTTNSLQAIFAETIFRDQDPDQDGFTNEEEFEVNTDPYDNYIEPPTGLDDGGAGCSTVNSKGPSNPTGGLLLLIPLFFILWIRNRSLFTLI